MINLKQLDIEYKNYKNIKNLYIKYSMEFTKFIEENREELTNLLNTYNSLRKTNKNNENQDKLSEKSLSELEQNPLFKKWQLLNNIVMEYKKKLLQYSINTYAFIECSEVICLKHKEDNGYDLLDLSTQDRLDLNQYDKSKQQYIINDLRCHHSFIGYIIEDELPIFMQVYKELDKEIVYNFTDSEEEIEKKYWNEITRCHIIKKEFEKRRNSSSYTPEKDKVALPTIEQKNTSKDNLVKETQEVASELSRKKV